MQNNPSPVNQPTKLLNRNAVLLLQGQFVSMIGSQIFSIGMMFWIKHATGSATLMGLVMMASTLPSVLLGPFGGTIADRYNRRNILVITDFIKGASISALAVMYFTMPDSTEVLMAGLFVVAVIGGIANSLFRPAAQATIPDIVPPDKIAAANAFSASFAQVANFIGQGVGGVLFRLLGGPAFLFLIDGITYFFSAISEMFIKTTQVIPKRESLSLKPMIKSFLTDTGMGFKYVAGTTGLKTLFLAAAVINFFGAPMGVTLPIYVEDTLLQKSDLYGFLLATLGVGSIIGFILAGALRMPPIPKSRIIMAAPMVIGLMYVVLGVFPGVVVAFGTFFVFGIAMGIFNVHVMTLLQSATPPEVRGRVLGLMGTMAAGLVPIAMGVAGVVTDLVDQNVPLIFQICGYVILSIAILLTMNRGYRIFMASTPMGRKAPVAPSPADSPETSATPDMVDSSSDAGDGPVEKRD